MGHDEASGEYNKVIHRLQKGLKRTHTCSTVFGPVREKISPLPAWMMTCREHDMMRKDPLICTSAHARGTSTSRNRAPQVKHQEA
jgi:hypothetical protein